MPSRAVVRKKQRRDAKRKRADDEGSTPSHRIAPPRLGDGEEAGSPAYHAAHPRSTTTAPRKRGADDLPAAPLATSPATVVLVAKRVRVEAPPPEPMPEGLTRKERHRWEASQRLQRQMTRLETTADAVKEMLADAAAQKEASGGASVPDVAAEDGAAADGAAPEEPKLRHDPKFKNGTFWRDRKEKRARTLFLGGIPSHFKLGQIKDFISTVIDSDPNAIDYVDQIGKEKDVVEEVDVLPVKHQSKVKHMYVTMASVPLAGCAAAMLDRYKMDGRELRCNFAADRTQRDEAIRRRSAAAR